MAAVTDARSTLIEEVDYEQLRVISNAGTDSVEVSTDKHFTYGQGIRIPSSGSTGVVLHKGESLYAVCAPGETATVTADAAPPDPSVPAPAFAHLTEDAGFIRIATDFDLSVTSNLADPGGLGETFIKVTHDHIESQSAAATDEVVKWYVDGEAEFRFIQHADGSLHWGDGTSASDVSLSRNADAELECDRPIRVPTHPVYGHVIGVGDDILLSRNGLSGALHLFINGAAVDLSVDGDGDLTVGGAKVLHA